MTNWLIIFGIALIAIIITHGLRQARIAGMAPQLETKRGGQVAINPPKKRVFLPGVSVRPTR